MSLPPRALRDPGGKTHLGADSAVSSADAEQSGSQLQAQPEHNRVRIESLCRLTGKTGVEMEALTAASVAALTIYDMCKAVQKDMVIGPVRLLAKSGGKSGDFKVEAMIKVLFLRRCAN
jgi:hypothetical protein